MTAVNEKFVCATKKCTSCHFLKELSLFANLPDKEVQIFADAAHIKSYTKGQYLYMEGEEAKFFYVMCSGWLKLLHVTEDGEEIVIAMLTKNNITGESAIFEQGNFASTAQIVEDAQILSIPIALLKEQMSVSNKLALNMLTSMIQYQRRHEMQVEQFLLYSAPQRVGCFILGLCPVFEQKDGVEIELPYDKTLIANTLGMKGPTFSRALNMLRDETGTRISGSRVTIDSIKGLLKFVDGCYLPHHLRKE
ncbi:MAG: Crp/Fnr family transcriptional regulator [Rickettsiales bacterium]